MPEMMLSVHGVHVGYGSSEVLHDVNLDLPPGSFLAVVGPNGSGKSTLLKTMARALSPTLGTATLDGKDISSWRPTEFARRVAVVSQQGSPAFDYTAYEVVHLGRAPYERRLSPDPKAAEIVESAMRQVGVWEFRDRNMESLSGGERQLVALARAVAQEPDVLLLDEPTNHLDIRHQVEFMESLARMNRGGLTVLMVVHDLNLAARYARRVAVVSSGTIFAAGTPSVALTPENIEEVFGTDVEVSVSQGSGEMQIHPVRLRAARTVSHAEVHVVCGGGSGANLMRRLDEESVSFSAGVLNVGDTDHAIAYSLGTSVVEGESFAPISDEAHALNLRAAISAKLVVVCDMPVGNGNLRNIEAASDALDAGVSVIILRDGLPPCSDVRDHSGGRYDRLVEKMLSSGATKAHSIQEVANMLDGLISPES